MAETRIETSVKVYLVWDAESGAWRVDPIVFDGYPLDSNATYDASPELGGPYVPASPDEMQRAQRTDMPTGAQLVDLLAQARP